MEVQVRHALPRLLADVGDHAVALDAHFLCHLGDDLKDVRDHGAVLGVDAGDGRDMRLGDHKEVRGSLRRNVAEGVAQLVLIDLVRGDLPRRDGAEQTVLKAVSYQMFHLQTVTVSMRFPDMPSRCCPWILKSRDYTSRVPPL